MAGSVFKRCGCLDARGRPVWRTCALLRDRAHGSWAYRIDLGPGITPDGRFQHRRQRYRSGFPTKREAEAALAAVIVAGSSGERIEASRMTVGLFLREWLDGKVSLRPSTRASYERYLDRYFIPHIGQIQLRQLRARDIELMYAQIRQGSGRGVKRRSAVSPATVARVHATLKGALNLAVRRKQLPYNPALGVELETARRPPIAPYELEELGRFLDEAGRHPLGVLFEVMALTGLRRGEAVGLRWQDVDLTRAQITVRQQVVVVEGVLLVGPPKTHSGEHRRVDLDRGTVRLLTPHQARQLEQLADVGMTAPADDRVFTGPLGRGISPEHVTRQFKVIAKRAGLPVKRLHDLRHGAASLQLAAGVDIAVVSKRLGHSTITLTTDTYSHLLRGVGADAAERSAALVPRRRPEATSPLVHKSCTSGSVEAVERVGVGAADKENPQIRGGGSGI